MKPLHRVGHEGFVNMSKPVQKVFEGSSLLGSHNCGSQRMHAVNSSFYEMHVALDQLGELTNTVQQVLDEVRR